AFPGERYSAAAAYDPLRDRIVMFGGTNAGHILGGTWEFTLSGASGWMPLASAGLPPSDRVAATMIYDPVGDRMILFGGRDLTYRNDVWSLSLSGAAAWTEIHPSGTPPGGRVSHAAIYDPMRMSMVVFGGEHEAPFGNPLFNDTWELPLAGPPAWIELAPAGPLPAPRSTGTYVYDADLDRLVVVGGWGGYGVGGLGDVWA